MIVRHKPRLHVSCNLGMRQEPGSASYLVLQLLFAAESGEERFDALLCHVTVDNRWQLYFIPCFRDPLTQICRGAQPPVSSVQGGCSPPRPPASYASDTQFVTTGYYTSCSWLLCMAIGSNARRHEFQSSYTAIAHKYHPQLKVHY